MIQNRKRLFSFLFVCAVLFLVGFALSHIHYALADAPAPTPKPLENDYPKIPLTNLHFVGSYSLNDIWNRTGPFATLDPLSGLIVYAFSLAVMLSGLVAFGVLIYAGVMFMFSGAKPQLRTDAKKKLWNAFMGIALLLGSVVILNTINPELKILTISTRNQVQDLTFLTIPQGAGSDSVALDSLQYGGVVLFANKDKLDGAGNNPDNMTNGSTDRSETLLNNIKGFSAGTYIGEKSPLAGIKLLGNCAVTLFSKNGFADTSAFLSLFQPGITTLPSLADTKSLRFENTACLGNSVTAYSDDNFWGLTKIFLTNRDNFKGDTLSGSKGIQLVFNDFDLSHNIVSIKLALPNIAKVFTASLCANPLGANAQNDCLTFTADVPQLPVSLLRKASSIVLTGGANRQAGVILYKDTDFGGKSEVLIAEDRNLQANFIGRDTLSSLMIVGKYKITLYKETPNTQWVSADPTITFDNTGNSVEISHSPVISEDLLKSEPKPVLQGGIIKISQLSQYRVNADTDWNDEVRAIRIQVPKSINDAQNLGGICNGDLCDL